MTSIRDYIGQYYPPPYGCLQLASQVLKHIYRLPIPEGAVEHAMEVYRDKFSIVNDPKEGDLILLKGKEWHVGVIVRPGKMLHTLHDGYAIIEEYNGIVWKNRVKGFYRWNER